MKHRVIFMNNEGSIRTQFFMEANSAIELLSSILYTAPLDRAYVRGEWECVIVKGGTWMCSINARTNEEWGISE